MGDVATEALEAGRRALAAGAWDEARAAYVQVLREQDEPEALDGPAGELLDADFRGRDDGVVRVVVLFKEPASSGKTVTDSDSVFSTWL
ncbi:MAG: hypothetical protein JWM06_2362 [Actinomycetia bacterium]|nr:hypothetical protein [Actinomycetes bacterium]